MKIEQAGSSGFFAIDACENNWQLAGNTQSEQIVARTRRQGRLSMQEIRNHATKPCCLGTFDTESSCNFVTPRRHLGYRPFYVRLVPQERCAIQGSSPV